MGEARGKRWDKYHRRGSKPGARTMHHTVIMSPTPLLNISLPPDGSEDQRFEQAEPQREPHHHPSHDKHLPQRREAGTSKPGQSLTLPVGLRKSRVLLHNHVVHVLGIFSVHMS